MATTDDRPATAEAEEAPMPRLGALGYPNYLRFWLANVARVFGLQFRFIGAGWLTQQLEGSTVWLGVEVARSGDIAYETSTYTLTMTDPKTKKPVTETGAGLVVWKKQADGSWKAHVDAPVSNPPAPPAK